MTVKLLQCIPLMLFAACMEQRTVERFTATVNRLCVTPPLEQTVDQHLSTHPQGCVLVSLEQTLAAGLNEVGLTPGVYKAQATGLGFTHYRNEVIVTRTPELLAVMTPVAFQELTEAAGAVHEARLEEQQLREGRGLVILGTLQAFAPAGFQWIACEDAEQSVVSFLRQAKNPEDCLLIACHFTPVPRHGYRIGAPSAGYWQEVINTDGEPYGGSNVGNGGGVWTEAVAEHGHSQSLVLTLPPLAALFLRCR